MNARLSALVDEVASAIGRLAGGAAEVSGEAPVSPRHWMATLTATGAHAGRCTVAIDHSGAAQLVGLLSGGPGTVEDASVGDLLREILSQAAAALAGRPAEERLDLALSTLEPREAAAADGESLLRAISAPGLESPLAVAVSWSETVGDSAAARSVSDEGRLGSRIDVILDIDLPVVVRFGRTEMPIRALSRIGPGSVIDLGRSPDDPVEVLVSNRVVARGEVVIVGGNYGVRILDVASQSERARSMEG
jgi:flagellar motor switch protein FliN/FliY